MKYHFRAKLNDRRVYAGVDSVEACFSSTIVVAAIVISERESTGIILAVFFR